MKENVLAGVVPPRAPNPILPYGAFVIPPFEDSPIFNPDYGGNPPPPPPPPPPGGNPPPFQWGSPMPPTGGGPRGGGGVGATAPTMGDITAAGYFHGITGGNSLNVGKRLDDWEKKWPFVPGPIRKFLARLKEIFKGTAFKSEKDKDAFLNNLLTMLDLLMELETKGKFAEVTTVFSAITNILGNMQLLYDAWHAQAADLNQWIDALFDEILPEIWENVQSNFMKRVIWGLMPLADFYLAMKIIAKLFADALGG